MIAPPQQAIDPAVASLYSAMQSPQAEQPTDSMFAGYKPKVRPSSGLTRPTPMAQNSPFTQAVQQARPVHAQAMQQQAAQVYPSGQGAQSSMDTHPVDFNTQDPGEQWALNAQPAAGQQGISNQQIAQRRAMNKVFSSLDPKQADTARAIVDAGGNLDHVMKFLDMQSGIANKTSEAAARESKTNEETANNYAEQNKYGAGGLKGYEAEQRANADQAKLQAGDERSDQSHLLRLQSMKANLEKNGSPTAEVDQEIAASKQRPHSNVESAEAINASAAGHTDIVNREAEISQGQQQQPNIPRAPKPGTPLSIQVAQQFLQAANGDKDKARQMARENGWSH